MAIGFDINKRYSEIAVAEIEAVCGVKGRIVDGFYVVDSKYNDIMKSIIRRLAFTRAVYSVEVSNNRINRIIKKKEIADLNKINKFERRRAHLLPAGHPAMTTPRVARAMVNLSGAKREILDPFCGGGGILIEAGLVGLRAVGFDIDDKMIERAKVNLDGVFGNSRSRNKSKYGGGGNSSNINYKLKKEDATKFSGRYEAIATDLPYGRNTKISDELEDLYLKFLRNVEKNKIKKNIVVGFPDFVDCRKLIKEVRLKQKAEFTYYLHRNLSKRIVVLQI